MSTYDDNEDNRLRECLTQARYGPMKHAAEHGWKTTMTSLLDAGYSVNQTYEDCEEIISPLHVACTYGHLDCVQYLIDNGAMINSSNIDGGTALCDAACLGRVDIVQLLLDKKADVNPPFCLSTPLHEAVMADNWKCAKLLISAGAKMNAIDCHFGTPLHIAANRNHYQSAKILLLAGAKVDPVMFLFTPLHYAAKNNNVLVARLLLQFGADVHARNNQDLTPVQLSQPPLTDLLRDYERNVSSLQHYCRLSLYGYYRGDLVHLARTTSIPTVLKRYLQFEEL